MSDDTLQARLRARLEAQRRQPPLQVASRFLRGFCSDALHMEEVREDMIDTKATNPYTLQEGLAAIEALLANPPSEEGTLATLVMWEANWGIDEDPTDAGATVWLGEMAELIRDVLGNDQPPRDTSYLKYWFPNDPPSGTQVGL
jgi:hypothetical protein